MAEQGHAGRPGSKAKKAEVGHKSVTQDWEIWLVGSEDGSRLGI